MRKLFVLIFILTYSEYAYAVSNRDTIDLLVFNGTIYTVDSAFTKTGAMVIHQGKVVESGEEKNMRSKFIARKELDLQGLYVYPGFIDAHCHFYKYAEGLGRVNLVGTSSWEEVLTRVESHAQQNKEGWLVGRGWDQNDWEIKDYPTNAKLNELFPNRPVFLYRIDGHAAIANDVALKTSGLSKVKTMEGGEILRNKRNKPTGVLIDNAVDLAAKSIPLPNDSLKNILLRKAETICLALGLTGVVDCGLSASEVEHLHKLYNQEGLHIRTYAMLSDAPENFRWMMQNGPIQTPSLQVKGFKVYADGALGSRGACLLQPYADRKDWRGFMLSPKTHFDSVAQLLFTNNWQMCTHAIGDSANRAILKLYAQYLPKDNDRRWRIEHAQVVHPDDIPLFGQYHIVPSVQPTHAISDMYWAEERLGADRIRDAYRYQSLYNQNGWMPLGTDFPVEEINPILTFHAAVVRKNVKGFPEEGYQRKEALSREQALKGMTIWAAKSIFEEERKGSLEPGKYADFIVLDKDIMTVEENQLPEVQVLKTYINGKLRAEHRKLQ